MLNIIGQLVAGAIIGAILTGAVTLTRFLWIKHRPLKIDPKGHIAAGDNWTLNCNLLLTNRSKNTCHAIWLAITTNNSQYDFTNFTIQETQEYPPYGQAFPLKDILVSSDFTHILQCEENNKTYKTLHMAMVLPGDKRLFNIKASNTRKKQYFYFQIVGWSRKPVQVLTENGKVAIQFSIPPKLCDGKIKMIVQGLMVKRLTK